MCETITLDVTEMLHSPAIKPLELKIITFQFLTHARQEHHQKRYSQTLKDGLAEWKDDEGDDAE